MKSKLQLENEELKDEISLNKIRLTKINKKIESIKKELDIILNHGTGQTE